MWTKVNLNDRVRVKRTPEIDALLLKHHVNFWSEINPAYVIKNPVPHTLLEDTEYLNLSLWAFIEEFGYMFRLGNPIPMELANIELEVK